MIKYLKHDDIDKAKWDACIAGASNGLIYGRYDYLECMSKRWDALVADDYSYVMPLPWNKKFGFNYLYQPFFCASLGIFGNGITGHLVSIFLTSIPSKFSFWDIYLNRNNFYTIEAFQFNRRSNFILNLDPDFKTITSSFSRNHLKNIALAKKTGLAVKKNIGIKEIVGLAKKQARSYSPIKSGDYSRFEKIYAILKKEGNAVSYGVYSVAGELLASAVFFFSNSRAYYILVGNNPKGRNTGASHYLIYEFIKDHSGKDLILDFEGSNIGSIARFYKSFGAAEEVYPGVKVNKLPALVRLFRK